MRPGISRLLGVVVMGTGLLIGGLSGPASRGDEPSRLGRLFRLGSNNASPPSTQPRSSTTPSLTPPPSTSAAQPPATSTPRILPQPRNSRPVTEADPILSRAAVNRSSDGALFCDFVVVYADGTILDSGGVHHVGRETLKPLAEIIHSGDAFRVRGHCGGPPTDYIEQVHVVVYDRSLGRLRAYAFSYSGNTEGCDPTIKQIHAAVEAIQTKVSGPATMAPATAGPGPATPGAPALAPPNVPAAPSPSTGRAIPLTPLD
jgi:hypothetical protein